MPAQEKRSASEWGFQRAPPEVRLKIWEATWPGPRLIEVKLPAGADESDEHKPQRIKPSRQVGLHNLKACKSSAGPLEDISCRDYFHPVALQVCRESRNHTLKTYSRLQHARVDNCSYYLDPRCDVLWLHRDFKDFDLESLRQVRRVLLKDVERSADSEADKKQRRRDLLQLIETMGDVREIIFLIHWTSIMDPEANPGPESETLYDWMWYSLSLMDENWKILERNRWVLQFLSTWSEFGMCLDQGEARLWGDAQEGPRYGCPSHDVVHRKRLVERYPKTFRNISRISSD